MKRYKGGKIKGWAVVTHFEGGEAFATSLCWNDNTWDEGEKEARERAKGMYHNTVHPVTITIRPRKVKR